MILFVLLFGAIPFFPTLRNKGSSFSATADQTFRNNGWETRPNGSWYAPLHNDGRLPQRHRPMETLLHYSPENGELITDQKVHPTRSSMFPILTVTSHRLCVTHRVHHICRYSKTGVRLFHVIKCTQDVVYTNISSLVIIQ